MKNPQPLLGIALAIVFIFIGIYLIQQEENYKVIFGYISIVFWSGLLLLSLYKKIITKKTNN
jgi:succinate dehydrogenase hydrophobic anchor subunit